MATRSKNIFAYLDSDDEETPKVSKKETAPPAAPVALNKPAAGNKKAGNKKNVAPVEADKKERAPREAREGGDAREGGRGRGGRGGARGGRRDFERRSGTGRGRETSKHGGGSRNWGNDADKTELVAEAEVQDGKVKSGEEDETTGEETTPVVEAEEEEVQLSYDEYLAKKKESRVGELFAEQQVRQVVNEFTNAKVITKEGKTPDFMDAQYEKVFTKKSSGRKKQLITDLGFQAPAPEREPRFRDDAGGRGGRGREGGRGGRTDGGRGRGGRTDGGRGRGSAGRGGRGSAAPNVGDLSAFPSL